MTNNFEHLKLLVLSDVNAERYRQEEIHPEILTVPERFQTLVEEIGEVATALQNRDSQNLYEELIQVAASAVRMAEQVAEERGAAE